MRQDKTWRDKTDQSAKIQDKTSYANIRQYMTMQTMTRQGNTIQDKTSQDKTTQFNAK